MDGQEAFGNPRGAPGVVSDDEGESPPSDSLETVEPDRP